MYGDSDAKYSSFIRCFSEEQDLLINERGGEVASVWFSE